MVHCPNFAYPPSTKRGHEEAYQDTIKISQEVRNLGISVRVILGPHPAAFAHQFETLGDRAEENYWDSIDAAMHFVREGQAHGIGEVGRPHWKVSDDTWDRSNKLLLETMTLAAKEGIPLQLHVEGESDETYGDLAKMADKAGLSKERVVRHYAPSRIDQSYTHGITPSVLAGSGSIDQIMKTHKESSHGFMLETDYIDDPKRPGAVLGPKTVPKRTRQLLAAGLDEEILYNCHLDLPNRIYGEI